MRVPFQIPSSIFLDIHQLIEFVIVSFQQGELPSPSYAYYYPRIAYA